MQIDLLSKFLHLEGPRVEGSMQSPWALFACGVVSAVVLAKYWWAESARERARRPPGPKGIPIFGNAFQLTRNAWTVFEDWKAEFGPLVYIKIAHQPFIILNSNKVAQDLLTRRANRYSDRHRSIVAAEILCGGIHIAFARYGEGWRRIRRAAHQALHKDIEPTFASYESLEAVVLAHSLLRDPEGWDNHFQRATASLIMAVTYNLPPLESETDPSISHIRQHMDRLAYALYPGNFFVEFFNWMNHIPAWAAKWKRDAQYWFKKDSETFLKLYGDTQERMTQNDNPSFISTLEAQKEQHNLTQLEKAWLAASMYGAGAETSFSSLQWFIVAMVHHPEVQKRAQAEIDAVVGRDRAPDFGDMENLPYVRACVREVLRWRPPIPMGLPHRLTEDDYYEGHFIPAGTLVLANVWAINRDTDFYGPDAREFRPDRHVNADGNLMPAPHDTQDEGHGSFGYGRRICVGRHVANSTLFIDFATMLWAMNFGPHVDSDGVAHYPDVEKNTNTGLTLHPPPFPCSIKPRFPQALPILDQTKDQLFHAQGLV